MISPSQQGTAKSAFERLLTAMRGVFVLTGDIIPVRCFDDGFPPEDLASHGGSGFTNNIPHLDPIDRRTRCAARN